MGKMSAVADRIIKRVRGKGRGWAFTPKDFLDLGTRASVDMALTRLVQAGHIRRIGRGLYDYPKLHDRLGALTPDADTIVQAVATQSGDKVVVSWHCGTRLHFMDKEVFGQIWDEDLLRVIRSEEVLATLIEE
jgi:hypothetical protein